jgi:hypothetical protein
MDLLLTAGKLDWPGILQLMEEGVASDYESREGFTPLMRAAEEDTDGLNYDPCVNDDGMRVIDKGHSGMLHAWCCCVSEGVTERGLANNVYDAKCPILFALPKIGVNLTHLSLPSFQKKKCVAFT